MTTSSFSVLSAGLVVLDIVLVNGDNRPLYQAGGTCCNVSCMLGYMGGTVSIAGRLGADAASRAVINDLHLHKVNTSGIICDLKETPSIIEKVNPKTAQHSFSLRCSGCSRHLSSYRSITLDHAKTLISEDVINVDLFFFDRVTPGNLLLAEGARRSGALIFFEPPKMEIGGDFYKAIKLCHIVKYASSTLGKVLSDGIQYPDDFKERPFLEIETLGKDGLKFRQEQGKWVKLEPNEALNVVDTTGAGDWLSASFIHSLLSNRNAMQHLTSSKKVTKYLQIAQQVASYNCQFIGARGAMDHSEFPSVMAQIRNNNVTTFPHRRRPSIIDSVAHTECVCSICLQLNQTRADDCSK